MRFSSLFLVLLSASLVPACSKDATPTGGTPAAGTPSAASPDHSGKVIELGNLAIGAFTAHATRDQGDIVPGKDAPIDVTVTPVAGSNAKVVAVRFWIGLEDGKASVKAKAAIEDPKQPDRWHTHAEIPSPLPEGSRLWVEIESATNERAVGAFDLAR